QTSARRQGALDGARARALWEDEHWPLERIDRVREAADRGILTLTETLTVELQRLFCAPRSGSAAVFGDDERDEASALVGARHAFEQLRELARSAARVAPHTVA